MRRTPDEYLTTISYRVPYADTDQMGVVYYTNYLVYFERLRNEMLRALGYTYREMEAEDRHLPVREAFCAYHRSARFDDLLTVGGNFAVVSPVRLEAWCEVRRGDDLLAAGHTVHVCFSKEKQRPCKLPRRLLDAIRAATAPGN